MMKGFTPRFSGIILFVLILTLTASAQTFKGNIPIPYLMTGDTFNLTIENALHNFDPSQTVDPVDLNVPVSTYTYNETGRTQDKMTYLGPTMIWRKGHSIQLNITNTLKNAQTTIHWHGMNLPSEMDGGPHQVIDSNSTWNPHFNMIDSVQTLWYHPHMMDFTTVQVIWGLAGMIIIEDTIHDAHRDQLPHEYGVNDFPIVIQEKGFSFDTTGTAPNDTIKATGMVVSEKPGNGDYTLINGVVNGVLHVPPQMVRLRMLNGSPRKSFHVGVSAQLSNPTAFDTMWQIGTDGGYTAKPHPTDSILISPGERMEMIVDFSGKNTGDTLYLSNLVRSVPGDIVTGGGPPPTPGTPGDAFMAFVVSDTIHPADSILSLPASLQTYSLDTSDIFRHRTKQLMQVKGSNGKIWLIDNEPMDMMKINDTVLVNKMEKWTIKNTTGIAHPFHIHKVQFQVVEYTGNTGVDTGNAATTYKYPNLPDYMMGFKDDLLIRAGATMSFVARFDSFPDNTIDPSNGFMYHCHILTHEDTAMMHQFVVVDSAAFYTSVKEGPRVPDLFSFYPNPAASTLYLNGVSTEPGRLRFTDLLGRSIREEQIPPFNGTATVSLKGLPRGILLVEWISGNQRYTQKLVLE